MSEKKTIESKELEKNIPKLYLLQFFSMFMIIMPVVVPFFESRHFTMAEIYTLVAIFSFGLFIFEVPSGYISDLFGRKKTLAISYICSFFGFLIFPLASDYYAFVVAEIILALGVSLASGTDTSLLYDSLDAIKSKKAGIKILGKMMFYSGLGEGIAALFTSLLILLVTLNDIAWFNAVVALVPIIISFMLIEPERNKMDKKDHKGNLKHIYRSLFKHSALLNLIILNIMFYSVATFYAVWMFQKYWNLIGIPIIYFGYLWALSNFVFAITSKYAHKIEKSIGSVASLLSIGILLVCSYLGMGVVDTIFGVIFCYLFQVCRGLTQVLLRDALNKRVKGDIRATANSIAQMGSRILFIVFGPMVGHLIDTKGVFFTSKMMGVVYIFTFFIILIPLVLQRKNFVTIKK